MLHISRGRCQPHEPDFYGLPADLPNGDNHRDGADASSVIASADATTVEAMAQVQSEFETRTWQAFWRSVVDGIATSEVAQELQMSEATVRQSRSRILRRLRQQPGDMIA